MNVPDRVKELTETFDYNLESYKKGIYNETQVRREFIDPFFEELGWDVANKQGYAEAYKDVIHEDAIKVGGITKAPDYCFRVGGARKFFLEAKKPSVNIQENIHSSYQLRRYGWSAKLPLSILTDFEEFAVYDCRMKPVKTDKGSHSRILYLKYTDYADRWEEIAGIFSRDAILKGSFDKYVESNKIKKGTTEVDAAFLQEIERWRELLARNIALRNPNLSQRELNFAVQQTIDRIVFLRICEDRGMEAYGGLMALRNGENVYKRLFHLFNKADEKYNSGLFHFSKEKGRENCDNLTPSLQIDDKPLKDIFNNLYYPESPYEFSVLSADILGQVYEKFLGKVIRLTAGHQAKIEEKPEVRKAGGVYYTPDYIVDYIVKNTVGKLVEGKKPGPRGGVSHLTILDPACGSGSFLIGAYQFLLDWHRDEYINDGPENWSKGKTPRIYQSRKGEWRLTTDERKRILLNNIYGVDIDHQAVEVTKLSLLLKVLEGEDEQSIGKQMSLFQERVLPDLLNNIKCGNSLIGPDFYVHRQMSVFDEEEIYRVNAFDWNAEFAEIMKDGGFDAVIGNPPWGASFSKPEQNYLYRNYDSAHGKNIDSYAVFTEIALTNILKYNGTLGFIVPDTFLRKGDYLQIRRLFLEKSTIEELIETGPVFSKVRDTWCLVFCLHNRKPLVDNKIRHKKISRFVVSVEERLRKFGFGEWDVQNETSQSLWMGRPEMIVGYLTSEDAQKIITKVEQFPRLMDLAEKYYISRGEEGSKYDLKEDAEGDLFIVIPKDVNRYSVEKGLKISSDKLTPQKIEAIYKHPKIWIIRIQKMRWKQRIVCSLDQRKNSAGMKTLQVIISPTDDLEYLKYLQGILSSKLINFWCINYLADDMNKSYLQQLPIRTINFEDPADIARHDQMVSLVDQMLDLNKRLAESKVPQTTEMLRRQIESTDRQIDQLVYRLYELTEEEIEIVESET